MANDVEYFSLYHDKEYGVYSDVTPVHHSVVHHALPYIRDALQHIPCKTDETYHIVDYGTGDGGTSMRLMNESISVIKQRFGNEKEILISYEDQQHNDYSALVTKIYEASSRSRTNIYVSICPTDFHRQCFPTATVHMGVSFTAMQWLPKSPCILRNGLIYITSNDEMELRAYADDAKLKWEGILLNRTKELRIGGRLVFAIPGVRSESVKNTPMIRLCFEKMEQIWKGMFKEDLITKEEFENASFRVYARNEKEFQAPFKDEQSAVYKSGLRLISTEAKLINSPFKKPLADGTNTPIHARRLVTSVRAWSNSSLYQALSVTRTEKDKTDILDEFYSRYEHDVIKNPLEHDTAFDIMYVVMKKVEC